MKRLFGYYRQFEELSPDEISRELRAQRGNEPVEQPRLDLSGAAWPGPPHPEVVNAATFALRRAVNAYPDDAPLRAAIAASHDISPSRVVIGHGAGELLRAALRAVAVGEVEVMWPGWGLLPSLVTSVGATPVPVARPSGTRTAVVCRPNDPTGEVVALEPGSAWLIVDEALCGFLDDAPILDHPRVIQVRSFSKIHAMAGFRVGYAVVPEDGPDLRPVLGVGAPALAGALWAVEQGSASAARRRAIARRARERLAAEFDVAPGEGPYAWLRAPVAEALAARRVYVAPGSAWGAPEYVRVTLGGDIDRLFEALRSL
jgi:histidinol-phosphate/aromatic aminotransferase/cobyric acid decarboxylase-like protein